MTPTDSLIAKIRLRLQCRLIDFLRRSLAATEPREEQLEMPF